MSEWIGWVSRLRRTIYARMEELSFRTGAATVAGVLAVAATAILLTLTQGGHHGGPPRAQAGLAPSSFLGNATIVALSPSAAHRHGTRRPAEGANARYAPGGARTPTATPQPAPSPSLPSPRHTFWTSPPTSPPTSSPVTHGPPSSPGFPWPWPTFSWP